MDAPVHGARAVKPGPPGLAQRPVRAGLDGTSGAPCLAQRTGPITTRARHGRGPTAKYAAASWSHRSDKPEGADRRISLQARHDHRRPTLRLAFGWHRWPPRDDLAVIAHGIRLHQVGHLEFLSDGAACSLIGACVGGIAL